MSQEDADKSESKTRRPFAGIRTLIYSIACLVLCAPIGELAGHVAMCLGYKDVDAWVVGLLFVFVVIVPIGLLFMIWGFIIGGKWTRRLCITWAFFVFVGIGIFMLF